MLDWWQGRGGQENLIFFLREDQCTVASCLWGQSHGVPHESRRSITSTIPRQATSPPTLPHSSPPPRALWFPAKANRKTTGSRSPRSHGDRAQGHSVGLDDLDLQGRTKKSIQSQPRDLDAKLSAGHWAWIHEEEGKKIVSVQDLSLPINQVIFTHSVTWRSLAGQRSSLSGLDGTSNRGVMGKDTTYSKCN